LDTRVGHRSRDCRTEVVACTRKCSDRLGPTYSTLAKEGFNIPEKSLENLRDL
jgi:hypothetical protein